MVVLNLLLYARNNRSKDTHKNVVYIVFFDSLLARYTTTSIRIAIVYPNLSLDVRNSRFKNTHKNISFRLYFSNFTI